MKKDPPDPLSEAVCAAIGSRSLLEFEYRGMQRIVAPYCHGWSREGAEVMRAVQVGGESRSGGFGFGKLWKVGEMKHPRASHETFTADDPDYNPDDSAMARIHCRVEPGLGVTGSSESPLRGSLRTRRR